MINIFVLNGKIKDGAGFHPQSLTVMKCCSPSSIFLFSLEFNRRALSQSKFVFFMYYVLCCYSTQALLLYTVVHSVTDLDQGSKAGNNGLFAVYLFTYTYSAS